MICISHTLYELIWGNQTTHPSSFMRSILAIRDPEFHFFMWKSTFRPATWGHKIKSDTNVFTSQFLMYHVFAQCIRYCHNDATSVSLVGTRQAHRSGLGTWSQRCIPKRSWRLAWYSLTSKTHVIKWKWKKKYFYAKLPDRLSSEFDLVHGVVERQDSKHILTSDLKIIHHYPLCSHLIKITSSPVI